MSQSQNVASPQSSNPAAPAAVAARGVSRSYREGPLDIVALRGIDLEVRPGELVVVTGPSGAGKSTLLHLLGGVDRPDTGSVEVDGVDISRLPERELALVRRRRIGFLLQFFNLLPTISVLENVAFPLLLDRRRDSLERARARLVDVSLDPDTVAGRLPGHLSGGEQQRVALARALVADPAIVLADEPTGNLDSSNTEAMLALLRRVADSGQAVLLVSHDPRSAAFGDRSIRLLDGRVVAADEAAR
jgi:putative ABC transport system ATP-binding protein